MKKINTTLLLAFISAVGLGGLLQAFLAYLKDRRKDRKTANKTEAETDKIDVETKLAYLTTVIERLDYDARRFAEALYAEQQRTSDLRKRVRELEDELDGMRRGAREMQYKYEVLEFRLGQRNNSLM